MICVGPGGSRRRAWPRVRPPLWKKWVHRWLRRRREEEELLRRAEWRLICLRIAKRRFCNTEACKTRNRQELRHGMHSLGVCGLPRTGST